MDTHTHLQQVGLKEMEMNELPKINEMSIATTLPVFWCSLDKHLDKLMLARIGIDELRQTHPESTPSNVKAVYMSPWKSHTLTPKFTPMVGIVTEIAKEVSRSSLKADLEQLNFDLVVTDCWGVIYEGADHTMLHTHFPADFSAVIYLEAGDDCAPIVFGNGIAVKPQAGLLVIFPGIMPHAVPQNYDRRVVLAMNLNKLPKFA